MVSGANGFVGHAVIRLLSGVSDCVTGVVRSNPKEGQVAVGEICHNTDWRSALDKCNSVIHLAARVHLMQDRADDLLAAYRSINTEGTLNLARQAAAGGVRRFVFLSSVKVNGESTSSRPFSEIDTPSPQDPYAISKWEAEQGLWEVSKKTGMEVVILRPPLVYGPGVKANFLRLMQWVDRGLPLPLASVDNRRNMIYLSNLVDAIRICLAHPSAAGKTFLVSDGLAVSTPELIRRLAFAMERPARLVPSSLSWMRCMGKLIGKGAAVDRLLGSLEVDMKALQKDLGWNPPYRMEEGLAATADWFIQRKPEL